MKRSSCCVAVAVSVALLTLAAPQAAHAAVTATFDPASGTLTVTGDAANDSITVARDTAGNIVVISGSGTVPITGGTPTVTNADAINIDAGGGDDTVTKYAANGAFAPGKTPTEPGGAPEIEFTIDLGPGADTFAYIGRDDTDLIGAGQIGGGSNGVSVNTDADLDDIATTGGEQLRVNLAGGGDVLTADGRTPAGVPFTGPYPGSLTVNAGEGADLVYAGAGTNTINGEGGNDDVGLRFGNSIVNLGSGTNVGFAQVGGAVTIGQVGGATRVSAPNVTGDFFDAGKLFIDGSSGDDTIDAAGAGVVLDIFALGGNDTVTGGSGNDPINGGEGNDKVNGGAGDDGLEGENGDDELRGGEGNDTAEGGEGSDTCEAEVLITCELSFPPPPAGPGGTTPPSGGGGTTPPGGSGEPSQEELDAAVDEVLDEIADALERAGIGRVVKAGAVVFTFDGEPGVYRLEITATIVTPSTVQSSARRKRVVIARATKRVTTAGRTRVRMKLTRQGRRTLRRARRLRVGVKATYTSTAGQRVSASRRVALRRKRR